MTAPVLDPSFRLSTEDLTRRTMHRIYWRGNDPLAASVAGNNRYDCSPTLAIAARYGVLYFAFDLETCWMETVVRANMVRPAGCRYRHPAPQGDRPLGMRSGGNPDRDARAICR